MLPTRLLSPPYTAVIERLPAEREEVVYVAVAEAPLPDNVPLPKTVVPSLNMTVPVGVLVPPALVTVAVNVTESPIFEGLLFDAILVTVLKL